MAVSLMATPAMATEPENTEDVADISVTEEGADQNTPEDASDSASETDVEDESADVEDAYAPATIDAEVDVEEDYSLSTYDVKVDAVEENAATASYSDGFHQAPDSSDWYYYKNGKIAEDVTDVIKGTVNGVTGWWNVVNGKVTPGITVAKNSSGWWYIDKDGKVDKTYTGFAKNANGIWYMENGKLTRKTNGVIKDSKGAVGSSGTWYYVLSSKVQEDFTGLADYKNASGWWYITNGKVDRSVNTVAKNKNGWYYVLSGKVQKDFTGLADYQNSSGWWYIKSGKVDRSYKGLAKNKNGWFYLKNGKVDRSYTGFAKNDSGSWYMTEGKLTRKDNTVLKDTTGALGSTDDWYYVIGSKVQSDFTGLADYSNSSGWWYITKGKVDRSFTGVASNKNGQWYIKNGKVQKDYTGTVTYNGKTYSVINGKATVNSSSTTSFVLPDDYSFTLSESEIIYAGKDTTQLETPIISGSVDSSGNIRLQWDAVSGAEKYRVFRKKYGDSSWTKLGDTTNTSYTTSTGSSAYYYTVRCVSSDGSTYMSDYVKGFSGSAVVGYALQFVGNPYVWAGISLTNGCDCSGFVMQVYAHFGVALPHYSGDQIKCGKAISSISDAQPGDIIGRDGHVVLYMGNDMIVQAQGSATGIVVTPLSATTYTSIRRIFN